MHSPNSAGTLTGTSALALSLLLLGARAEAQTCLGESDLSSSSRTSVAVLGGQAFSAVAGQTWETTGGIAVGLGPVFVQGRGFRAIQPDINTANEQAILEVGWQLRRRARFQVCPVFGFRDDWSDFEGSRGHGTVLTAGGGASFELKPGGRVRWGVFGTALVSDVRGAGSEPLRAGEQGGGASITFGRRSTLTAMVIRDTSALPAPLRSPTVYTYQVLFSIRLRD